MGKLEHRLFFYLLRRWSDKNYYKLDPPNGIVTLLRNRPYDLQITRDFTLRKHKPKTYERRD